MRIGLGLGVTRLGGGDRTRHMVIGTTGQYVSTPAVAAVSTELEVWVRLRLDDMTPAAVTPLFRHMGSAGNRKWDLLLDTAGRLRFDTTTDGTTTTPQTSSVALPYTDGTRFWTGATWRGSDGRVQFFHGADGDNPPASPTQLGVDRTGVTGTLFDSTAVVALPTTGTQNVSGRVHRAIIRSAIGGATTAEWNLNRDGLATPTTTVSASGETWTYVGSPTLGVG
jgi:hypothetical protein